MNLTQVIKKRAKLINEGDKLYAKGCNLHAEGDKLLARGHKLTDIRNNLIAKGRKLIDEGHQLINEGSNLLTTYLKSTKYELVDFGGFEILLINGVGQYTGIEL